MVAKCFYLSRNLFPSFGYGKKTDNGIDKDFILYIKSSFPVTYPNKYWH